MNLLVLAAYWEGGEMIPATLKEAGHGYVVHMFDKRRIDDLDIKTAEAFDAVIYVGVNGGETLPDIETLHRLKDAAPTILICPEASDKTWWHPLLTKYAREDAFDLIVNIDGNPDWPGSDRGITALTPRAVAPWGEPIPWSNRLINAGFCGGNSHHFRRDMLRDLGPDVLWRGGDPRPGTWPDYVAWTKQCRMVLNMARHGGGHGEHVKGRVIEAGLGGCLVLETRGSSLARWFEAGTDYLEYGSAAEARALIPHVLAAPHEYVDMALRYRAAMIRDHAPGVFWRKVFKMIGMEESAAA